LLKYRTQISSKSLSGHHRTSLSGYIFATKSRVDNRNKNLLSSNISSRRPHNMVNFGPLVTEIGPVVCGTRANFNGFCVLAALLHGSIGRQPNFAALNRGRHLYSAGRPSRWASAHILVSTAVVCVFCQQAPVAWWFRPSSVPQSVAGPFRFLYRGCGTSCLKTVQRRRHCQSSGIYRRRTSSRNHILIF